MDPKKEIFLLIENPLLKKGIEGVLLPYYNVQLLAVDSFTETLKSQREKNYGPIILLCDYGLIKLKNLIYLSKFIEVNKPIKIIILFNEFCFQEIRNFFSIGIRGVLGTNIDQEELLDIIREVWEDKRVLSKSFERKVLESFCTESRDEKIIHAYADNNEEENVVKLFGLTAREKEILNLICDGDSTKEISEKLSISPYTTDTHRRNLLQKLDVKNTAEMVKVAILNHLV